MRDTEVRRGEEAKRVLAEPLLSEAFEVVEAAIIAKLKTIDVGAMDAQRDLVVSLQLLNKVKGYIEQVAITGELAALDEKHTKRRNIA